MMCSFINVSGTRPPAHFRNAKASLRNGTEEIPSFQMSLQKDKDDDFQRSQRELENFSPKSNGGTHSIKNRCWGRRFKASFHQPRGKGQTWSRFVLKAAFPMIPALSSSLLTQLQAAGYNISPSIPLCSEDYGLCCALTSLIRWRNNSSG